MSARCCVAVRKKTMSIHSEGDDLFSISRQFRLCATFIEERGAKALRMGKEF